MPRQQDAGSGGAAPQPAPSGAPQPAAASSGVAHSRIALKHARKQALLQKSRDVTERLPKASANAQL